MKSMSEWYISLLGATSCVEFVIGLPIVHVAIHRPIRNQCCAHATNQQDYIPDVSEYIVRSSVDTAAKWAIQSSDPHSKQHRHPQRVICVAAKGANMSADRSAEALSSGSGARSKPTSRRRPGMSVRSERREVATLASIGEVGR